MTNPLYHSLPKCVSSENDIRLILGVDMIYRNTVSLIGWWIHGTVSRTG